jgi:hypothetical protein
VQPVDELPFQHLSEEKQPKSATGVGVIFLYFSFFMRRTTVIRRFVPLDMPLGGLIAFIMFASVAQASWVQIDDFQSGFGFDGLTPVTITNGQNNWILNGNNDGMANVGLRQIAADPTDANNAVLRFEGGGGTGTAKPVTAGQGIADGATGTIFLRFYMDNLTSVQFGILDTATAGSATGMAGAVVLGNPTTANNDITGYLAGSVATSTGNTLAQDTWYNLWVVLSNTTGAANDTVNFYLQGGSFATPTQLFYTDINGQHFDFTSRTNFSAEVLKVAFRPAAANRSSSAQAPTGGILLVDDIYLNNVGQDLSIPVPVPGDFNSDGNVDGLDFAAWQNNFPKSINASRSEGDADGDGDVDGADFVVWQTNFPFPSPSVTSVPEPMSLILAGFGLLALLLAKPRGRSPLGLCEMRQN